MNKVVIIILSIAIVILGYLWLSKSPEIVYDTTTSDSLYKVIEDKNTLILREYSIQDSLVIRLAEIVQENEDLAGQMAIFKESYNDQIKDNDSRSVADGIIFFSTNYLSDSASNK